MLGAPRVVVVANVGDVTPMAGRIELQEVAEQRWSAGGFRTGHDRPDVPVAERGEAIYADELTVPAFGGSPVITSRTLWFRRPGLPNLGNLAGRAARSRLRDVEAAARREREPARTGQPAGDDGKGGIALVVIASVASTATNATVVRNTS